MEKEELINYIKKVKQEKEKLENVMEQKRKEEEDLRKETEGKIDKESGFYKDANEKTQVKHKEFIDAFNKRQEFLKKADENIQKEKSELIKKLEEKAKWIDEHRKLSANDLYSEIKELNASLYAKKKELEYFENTLGENNDKRQILANKEKNIQDLNNEIKDKISKAELLKDGKAEEAYNSIKQEIKSIENLNINNVDKYLSKEEPTKTSEDKGQSKEVIKEENTKTSEDEGKETENAENENNKVEKNEVQEKNTEGIAKATNNDYVNIYSYSNPKLKDKVESININAAEGKAQVEISNGYSEYIDIKEAIKNKKSLFKRLDINERLEKLGMDSRIKRFMFKRTINPVILDAISNDEELTDEYLVALADGKKFPFEYKHSLENSILSNKETSFMNRIALKESKIEGNEVTGVEKLHKIKSFFRGIKGKAQKGLKKTEELKKLGEGIKSKNRMQEFKKQQHVDIEKHEAEQQAKNQEEYQKLTDEQKDILSKLSKSDYSTVTKWGIDYNTAMGMVEKYGKKDGKQQAGEKEQTSDTEEVK